MPARSLTRSLALAATSALAVLSLAGCMASEPAAGEGCDPAVDGMSAESAHGAPMFCNQAYPVNGKPGSWMIEQPSAPKQPDVVICNNDSEGPNLWSQC